MGIFLNPGNDRFRQALNSQIYVDKSGLISVANKRICSEQKYICVSRPRRFGKSVNLGMLAAYYSKGCDSRELFDGLVVSKDESYLNHLNKYNVIYLNMQQFLSESHDIGKMLELLSKSIMYDLEDDYEDFRLRYEMGLVYSDIFIGGQEVSKTTLSLARDSLSIRETIDLCLERECLSLLKT